MNVIIAGSRTIRPSFVLLDKLIANLGDRIDLVISGGAKGVDTIAVDWAMMRDVPSKVFLPKYNHTLPFPDKRAPKERNWTMAYEGDTLLAFWDGVSPGTAHMISCMVALNKITLIVDEYGQGLNRPL